MAERRSPFVALQHRNFRLLWLGLLVSISGSMMQTAAILWHVSLLVDPANRGLALGMVGLVRVVPIVTFSLVAGVIADAHEANHAEREPAIGSTSRETCQRIAAFCTIEPAIETSWPIHNRRKLRCRRALNGVDRTEVIERGVTPMIVRYAGE